MAKEKELPEKRRQELLSTLNKRFASNAKRHKGMEWSPVQERLLAHPAKLWTLNEMEITGGEPDVLAYDDQTGEYLFMDCSAESPAGRRSACYDREAQQSRKEHPPKHNAMDMAAAMGISLLTESEYRNLQQYGPFDSKTSSWLLTPDPIRKLGGALFGDFRYGQVFLYHNGAASYYAARGFRGLLRV